MSQREKSPVAVEEKPKRTPSQREAEWEEFRQFIESTRFFDLPAFTPPVWDGTQYDAVRLTARGGRRVFMDNPGSDDPASPYHLFVRRFRRLTEVAAPLRYDIFDRMPDARLIMAGADAIAMADGLERFVTRHHGVDAHRARGRIGVELPRRARQQAQHFFDGGEFGAFRRCRSGLPARGSWRRRRRFSPFDSRRSLGAGFLGSGQ